MGRIDVASFECPTCGHKSTPPEEVNAFAHQMENYGAFDGVDVPDKTTENILLQTLNMEHYGNYFTIETVRKPETIGELDLNPELAPDMYTKVITVERSYAEVTVQSDTMLEDSKHIVLSCPQCHAFLYEVRFSK